MVLPDCIAKNAGPKGKKKKLKKGKNGNQVYNNGKN